ncbi:MAG: hypothetical protein JNM17_38400 [Archangium sp.]|nr:hypothetical protein [Archangium sp.]
MHLLLLIALAASPLEAAQQHLAAGKLDDVLFELEGKTFDASETPKAVVLLSKATRAALDKKDDVLALQFAQMAKKLDAKHPASLEASARASFATQEFAQAERACDAWIALEPANGSARLLRAQLAVEAADWKLAVDQLGQAKLSAEDEKLAKPIRARATSEMKEKLASQSAVAALEKQLIAAAQKPMNSPSFARSNNGNSGSGDVVIYSASWCGYCKKAKKWLTDHRVSFVDKDVEKEEGAAAELAQKARSAGVRPSGVPVIDFKGKLILGFDQAALEEAVR